jgi:excinuclease ABC subunit A
LIDMGPEGGEAGGTVVAMGTPEAITQVAASHTGRFLAPLLGRAAPATAPAPTRGRRNHPR